MENIHSVPAVICLEMTGHGLVIVLRGAGGTTAGRAIYVALDTEPLLGSAVLPFGQAAEGSTVFLPIRADRLLFAMDRDGRLEKRSRVHRGTMWSEHAQVLGEFDVSIADDEWRLSISRAVLGTGPTVDVVVYEKDLRANNGWGRMIAGSRFGAPDGDGDRYVRRFERAALNRLGEVAPASQARLDRHGGRVRIYQVLPRLFGNCNETRRPNGALAENGVGKFDDINAAAIASLAEMGLTHVWLTGVLQQAMETDFSAIGEPADDPALVKGRAGSPYAIKDCFDLCPDYAVRPAERLAEFRALLDRLHAAGLRALIDFVPNHVARSHRSSVMPELTFGAHDDRTRFFTSQNNFFWLQRDSPGGGPPLRLPERAGGDRIFDLERDSGRATGNNCTSWRPGLHDWYETVKLNYGFDFTTGERVYPHGERRDFAIPDTWLKVDRVLAYWQEQGVDGFRCDMAHLVPPEFWAWAIPRARVRQPAVLFIAEAYNNDPAKVPGGDPLLAALNDHRGNVMFDLLAAGFDAVYDDPSYKTLKAIYDGSAWANDLDHALGADFIFQNGLRYAENHDEVRLAGRGQWGSIGSRVGRAVSAILYGLSRGPVLLYSGQEVGEPANGAEGFGGDDARTTIFDYWSMPELVKWVNGHRYDGGRLSTEQRALRAFYGRLQRLVGEPAFRDGEFFGLNPANIHNERFGRLPGEPASGRWLYAFLRCDETSGQCFFVIANLHSRETLRSVEVHVPAAALALLNLPENARPVWIERLSLDGARCDVMDDMDRLAIDAIPPLSAFYFELQLPVPSE